MGSKVNTNECYPFHKANIHEQRLVAVLCRLFPLNCFVVVGGFALYGTLRYHDLLIKMTAILNVSLWLWVVCTTSFSIYATTWHITGLNALPEKISEPTLPNTTSAGAGESSWETETAVSNFSAASVHGCTGSADEGKVVKHLIVLPNYKEDKSMLKETLMCLAECEGSDTFCVVLAMEAREGDEGRKKAESLQANFASKFAKVLVSSHPRNLVEIHLDDTETAEIPGKASNLKYSVKYGYEALESCGIDIKQVLLTVADADCLFHPLYFSRVTADFVRLHRDPVDKKKKKDALWTMWQAPQFQFRNYYTSPIVSRVWSYLSGVYEFGGLSSTMTSLFGRHHMVHSSYTMPLELAHLAEPWDGDGIAEDHHAFLTCFFHRLRESLNGKRFNTIDVRPVYLPVKSTAIANEEYLRSWSDRWSQARRHAQGVSELPYALLATYDAFMARPWYENRMFDPRVLFFVFNAISRLFCMHVLPILQGLCLGMLTATWFYHHRQIDTCPDRLWFMQWQDGDSSKLVWCGLAGAWVLTWPVLFPMILLLLSSFLLMKKVFLDPSSDATIWHSESGQVPHNSSWRVLLMILIDGIFMAPILLPYGFCVEVIAYFNVAIGGNNFEYVTANKGVCKKRTKAKFKETYGSIDEASVPNKKKPPLADLKEKLQAADSSSTEHLLEAGSTEEESSAAESS